MYPTQDAGRGAAHLQSYLDELCSRLWPPWRTARPLPPHPEALRSIHATDHMLPADRGL